MRTKRKVVLGASLACLVLLGAWIFTGPRVEVHGQFSAQDIAELKRLGRAEIRRDTKSDWSSRPRTFRQLTRVVRMYLTEHVIRIDQEPNDKAVVTTGTGGAESYVRGAQYVFVKSEEGWKLAPPQFE